MNTTIPDYKGVCQRCGEHIAFPITMQGENVPCPHCGRETTLIASIAPNLVHKVETEAKPPAVSGGKIFIAYLLAAFIPIIGFFMGIWLMTKKESGHGAACMALSIISFFFGMWLAATVGSR